MTIDLYFLVNSGSARYLIIDRVNCRGHPWVSGGESTSRFEITRARVNVDVTFSNDADSERKQHSAWCWCADWGDLPAYPSFSASDRESFPADRRKSAGQGCAASPGACRETRRFATQCCPLTDGASLSADSTWLLATQIIVINYNLISYRENTNWDLRRNGLMFH